MAEASWLRFQFLHHPRSTCMPTQSRRITMAGSLSTHPASELVDSSFAQVLHNNGPDVALASKLELYSWLVGRWDMDVTTILEDGTTHRSPGEIHAGWVLQGRAIQDVWMIPRLRDRRPGIEPLP